MKEQAERYFKENWGAPFILAFMALLLVTAGFLMVGLEAVASGVAVVAYFTLVVGVVLQLISFVRHGKGSRREEDGE